MYTADARIEAHPLDTDAAQDDAAVTEVGPHDMEVAHSRTSSSIMDGRTEDVAGDMMTVDV